MKIALCDDPDTWIDKWNLLCERFASKDAPAPETFRAECVGRDLDGDKQGE